MNWLNNMRVGTKLIAGFIIVSLIAGIVGIVGIIYIKNIEKLDTQLYEKMTVPLSEMVVMVESYQRMRGNVKDIVLSSTAEEYADYEKRIIERNKEFDTNLASFETTLLTDEGEAIAVSVKNLKKQYDAIVSNIISLAKQNKINTALELMRGDGEKTRTELEKYFNSIRDLKVTLAKEASEKNSKAA